MQEGVLCIPPHVNHSTDAFNTFGAMFMQVTDRQQMTCVLDFKLLIPLQLEATLCWLILKKQHSVPTAMLVESLLYCCYVLV